MVGKRSSDEQVEEFNPPPRYGDCVKSPKKFSLRGTACGLEESKPDWNDWLARFSRLRGHDDDSAQGAPALSASRLARTKDRQHEVSDRELISSRVEGRGSVVRKDTGVRVELRDDC